jgi:hypothetical protein
MRSGYRQPATPATLGTEPSKGPGRVLCAWPPPAVNDKITLDAWRSRFWNPAIRQAGVAPLRIHDIRHTAISLWVAAGASPKQIATWVGDTSVSIVLDRYGHLFEGHDTPVLANLDRFVHEARVTSGDTPTPWVPRVFRGRSEPESNVVALPLAETPEDPVPRTWAMADSNRRPLPCEGSALTN